MAHQAAQNNHQPKPSIGWRKKVLRCLLLALGAVLLAAIGFFIYLCATEYRPEALTDIACEQGQNAPISLEEGVSFLSYNTGYAGLGAQSDFFMDGGQMVAPAQDTLHGVAKVLTDNPASIYLLQEVDTNSTRSKYIDQASHYRRATATEGPFALNYRCNWVPFPLPNIGRVESGLLTLSAASPSSAQRIQLPVPFSWPVRIANLKRCLLVTRFPIEGSRQELVVVNLHLEAYDDGQGKVEQMNMLTQILQDEQQKGNYVVAGGDFNQLFPGTQERYPLTQTEDFMPGILEEGALPEGFSFVFDPNTPSCRLLNQPYDPGDAKTQHYVIDGYIVSGNLRVEEIKTIDEGFASSDHQAVYLQLAFS